MSDDISEAIKPYRTSLGTEGFGAVAEITLGNLWLREIFSFKFYYDGKMLTCCICWQGARDCGALQLQTDSIDSELIFALMKEAISINLINYERIDASDCPNFWINFICFNFDDFNLERVHKLGICQKGCTCNDYELIQMYVYTKEIKRFEFFGLIETELKESIQYNKVSWKST